VNHDDFTGEIASNHPRSSLQHAPTQISPVKSHGCEAKNSVHDTTPQADKRSSAFLFYKRHVLQQISPVKESSM
jgi:hypothetical protein